MKLRFAVLCLGSAVAWLGCHNFDSAYDECLATGHCEGSMTDGGATDGGTDGGTDSGSPGALLHIDQPLIDCGDAVLGEAVLLPFVITNVGQVAAHNVNVTSNASPIFISQLTCAGLNLEPNATCSGTVTLKTATLGPTVGQMRVTADTVTPLDVPLTGTGVPLLDATPDTLDFGTVDRLTQSSPLVVTLKNHSRNSMSGGYVASDAGSRFPFDLGSCAGRIDAGASCAVNVFFAPTSVGTSLSSIVFTGTRAGETASVALTGTGQEPSWFVLNVNPFQDADVGGSQTTTARVINRFGTGTSGAITLSLEQDAGLFSLFSGCQGTTLAPDAGCNFNIQFSPMAAGDFSALLVVDGSPGSRRTVPVMASGVDSVPVTVSVFDGGHVMGAVFSTFTCQGLGTCTASLRRLRTTVLVATPDTNFEFDRWSTDAGNCSTSNSCGVFPRYDAGAFVEAQFRRARHELTVDPNPGLRIISSPAGIDCGPTCDAGFQDDTIVTLTAVGRPGYRFSSYGRDCAGPNCSLLMSTDREVSSTAAGVNTVFVVPIVANSAFYSGGSGRLDSYCRAMAQDGRLPASATYVAWTARSTGPSFGSAIASMQAWYRTDGKPVADLPTDFFGSPTNASHLLAPIDTDVRGNTVIGYGITGTNGDGGASLNCSNFTGSGTVTAGLIGSTGRKWTEGRVVNCGDVGQHSIYCVGAAVGGIALVRPTAPAGSRRAFVTENVFNGAVSDPQMDSACNAEALDAGLVSASGFAGLRTNTNTAASSRFNRADGGGWYRVDGTEFFPVPTALDTSNPVAPLNVTAKRAFVEGCVWTGAGSTGSTPSSTPGLDCAGWMTASAGFMGGHGDSSSTSSSSVGNFEFFKETNAADTTCNQSCRFYCLER